MKTSISVGKSLILKHSEILGPVATHIGEMYFRMGKMGFSALKGQSLPFPFILLSVVVWFYAYQDPEHSRTITPTSSNVCLRIEA